MVVLDASALLGLLLKDAGFERTLEALGGQRVAHVPHLIETETINALRRRVRRGWLSLDRAKEALQDLSEFPLIHYPHTPLSARVWQLRDRFSAYDATYVALAEALGAGLATADKPLARGAAELIPVTVAVD